MAEKYKYQVNSYRDLFGFNLWRLMKERDLTNREMADKLDCSIDNVRRWKLGSFPTDETAHYLSLILDCNFDEFFKKREI